MARVATTIAMSMATDAAWRAMLQAIDTNIIAMGWTRSSDTGQLDTATSLAPTGSNQDRGYLMWQATDSLAGTNPMKFRINFGSAGGATTMRWRFRAGYTTDGAGNFAVGTNSFDYTDRDGPTSSATAYEALFSGDTNRIAVALFNNHASTSNVVYFSLERTHDSTGADTNVGIFVTASQGQQNNYNVVIPYIGNTPATQNKNVGMAATSSTLLGTDVGVFPIFPIYVIALNPSTQWLTYLTADIAVNTIFTISMYGATRTFITTRAARGANDQNLLAMRWDA